MAHLNKFCLPGPIILFLALVFLFFTSISLPRLSSLDFVRVDGTFKGTNLKILELRLGIWAQCIVSEVEGLSRACSPTGHGYRIGQFGPGNMDFSDDFNLGPAWTRGLAIHPVAAVFTFVAFILSLFSHATISLASSLAAFLAAFITTIAFICDIALLVKIKHIAADVGEEGIVRSGPGFWLTFVSIILLLISGCTVCFGKGRLLEGARPSYSSKGPFMQRFQMTPRSSV